MKTRGFIQEERLYYYRARIVNIVNRSNVILDVDIGFGFSKESIKFKLISFNQYNVRSKKVNAKYKLLRLAPIGSTVFIKVIRHNNKYYAKMYTEETEGLYNYKCEMKYIVDADTADLQIDLGFRSKFLDRFRFYGINAWETRGSEREKGLIAKKRLIELTPVGSTLSVKTYKDRKGRDGKGKYGRYLGELILPDDINVNHLLVEEGHARFQTY